MFERFTNRARQVLVVAQNEARSLNHTFIEPEHLLIGLVQGDGLAARALRQLGVSPEEVRANVSGGAGPAKAAMGASKVPFSRQAKKALEMSLREALGLGHNYIGTEHLVLGVLQVAEADAIIHLLGVTAEEVRERVLARMSEATAPDSERSPALVAAMLRARPFAGGGPMTTGHLLVAMLADDACQASKALAALGVTAGPLEAELAQIPLNGTSDGPPRPRAVDITLGQLTTTIDDPELAAALGGLTPEELRAALRRVLDQSPDPGGSG